MILMKNIIFTTCLLLLLSALASCSKLTNQIYIVELGGLDETQTQRELHHDDDEEIENVHRSYLSSVKESEEEAKASLLYSYRHSMKGFAALLSREEAKKVSEMEGVVRVHKSKGMMYSLHTTRSWEFVGLEGPLNPNWADYEELSSHQKIKNGQDLLCRANYGQNLIVGMIDSGVWLESKSFSDEGMEPVPQKWRGICQNGTAFNSSQCNRKIIGARYYLQGYESQYGPLNEEEDYKSARDKDGHGTHTASIVAGRAVPSASAIGGFANGTASGGAPMARIAIYKACWPIKGQSKHKGNVCIDIDLLKAMDDAIGDGVDVLSASIGYKTPIPYEDDVIGRAALHATKKNIVVVCSAGNNGPLPSNLSNIAPWIITVGASTVDRSFVAPIMLQGGTIIEGRSITPVHMPNSFYPLVLASQVELPGLPTNASGFCLDNSLDPKKVKGKIVVCMRGEGENIRKGLEVERAGGVGFILGNNELLGNTLYYAAYFIPSTVVTYQNVLKLIQYINSSSNPMAYILPGTTVLNTRPAPLLASFSSRGPNIIDPHILKPDIVAPGVDILAAWTAEDGPTRVTNLDKRVVKYNIESGTSMACPHVSAAAILLKAIHPTWTSAAIRSALITTAGTTDNTGNPLTDANGDPATPFAIGAGHFNPVKAADPGLVYDASYMDYLVYTCSIGATQYFHVTYKCPNSTSLPEPTDLNHPSIQIHRLNGTKNIKRTVTNVGKSSSVYTFTAKSSEEFSITATPNILAFNHVGQKISFNITVTAKMGQIPNKDGPARYYFGWYAWTNKNHVVRSQVAVSFT
ncbi:hypothetical protein HN51_057399 [Arachis hypogaea]|uniref:Subtilisin-like protease SBT5.6 n=1 Tax=Arachis hypogaea TaxID=3818 RepID=A0A444WWV5_ARAHY|nr:subtilisin-like protease SBT5.6 [Arachis ipaensis]XP_025681114.1 subtilisin-like protease SBT5.6 [Arachis hypogaea]QHN80740.1 uncharacterized protein DS421_20g680750 [Arachis hypogaea]RYQ81937.1 hypothetical protein Ahy_B10g100526 [Arachis hypogaea]